MTRKSLHGSTKLQPSTGLKQLNFQKEGRDTIKTQVADRIDCLSPKLEELDGPGRRATNQGSLGGRSHYIQISGRRLDFRFSQQT